MARKKDFQKHSDTFDRVGKIYRKSSRSQFHKSKEDGFLKAQSDWPESVPGEAFAARVVEVHKRYAFVSVESAPGVIDTKDVWLATIARRYLMSKRKERNFVCVGDRVFCRIDRKAPKVSKSEDLPRCTVEHMEPRTSELSRVDPLLSKRQHMLASNADQLIVVASFLKPTIKWGLIDRYLVAAEHQELPVSIVLTKPDLLESEGSERFREVCEERVDYLRSLGYPVYCIQANQDETSADDRDLARLRSEVKGKISVLSGHSGVGKSSLLNQFDPEIIQVVEPDDDIFYKGRHTTTFASFIKIGEKSYFIDTPGIRSFALQDYNSIDLSHCFPEFRSLSPKCKYRECSHVEEPDCAVKAALDAGQLKPWRYRSYVSILLGDSGREGRTRDLEEEFESEIFLGEE